MCEVEVSHQKGRLGALAAAGAPENVHHGDFLRIKGWDCVGTCQGGFRLDGRVGAGGWIDGRHLEAEDGKIRVREEGEERVGWPPCSNITSRCYRWYLTDFRV